MATTTLKLCLLTLLVTLAQSVSLNDRKFGGKSQRLPIMSMDETGDPDDDGGLFYNSDVIPEEKDADQDLLDTLLLDIMQSTNGTDIEKCQQYKAQINEVCMAKFVQRSRFRPEDQLPETTSSKQGDAPKRLTSTLATPQQICCEFRLTYLRCVLSNINFVCPLTEFNSLYQQVEGLSEICSRFFAKSSKKCRRRYRNRPATSSDPAAELNSTTVASR